MCHHNRLHTVHVIWMLWMCDLDGDVYLKYGGMFLKRQFTQNIKNRLFALKRFQTFMSLTQKKTLVTVDFHSIFYYNKC